MKAESQYSPLNSKTCITLVAGIVLLTFFCVSRLWNVGLFPVVSDEAMYINLGQIVSEDFTDMALFRKEGKHPLFMWLTAISLQVFSDPLLAGRTVSILSGLSSLCAIFLIARMLYTKRIAWIAACLWLFCPFTFFFDRLALVESLLCSTGLWTAWYALKLARGKWKGPKLFFILGTLAGLSFFTKAGALLFYPVILFILAIWKMPERADLTKSVGWALLGAGPWILPLMLFGKEIGYFNRTDLMQLPHIFLTPEVLATFPWTVWGDNLLAMTVFYISYLSLPLVLVLSLGILISLKERSKEDLALLFWAFFPALLILIFTKGFYSRYLLMFVPPLILLSARACSELSDFIIERWAPKIRSKEFLSAGILCLVLAVTLSDAFFLPGNWQTIH